MRFDPKWILLLGILSAIQAENDNRGVDLNLQQCNVQILIDKTLYSRVFGHEGLSSHQRTILLLRRHAFNALGRAADELVHRRFGMRQGFTLTLGDVKVYDPNLCGGYLCKPQEDIFGKAEALGLDSRDEYCLVILLTYQEFTKGQIGHAFVGGPDRTFGPCTRWSLRTIRSGLMSWVSQNTIVLSTSYGGGKRMTDEEAGDAILLLVMASFGYSQEEHRGACAPPVANAIFVLTQSDMEGRGGPDLVSRCALECITTNLDSLLRETKVYIPGKARYNCLTEVDIHPIVRHRLRNNED